MNLLKETISVLENHNKLLSDIKWIGTSREYVDINKFMKLADTMYDDDFGSPKVAEDLLIVGDNWWLERHEYDGSEWWEYKELPTKPEKFLELKALTIEQAEKLGFDVSCGWESLRRINGEKEQ